jgi:hypothetical protein
MILNISLNDIKRLRYKGPAEKLMVCIIVIGIAMLLQPLAMILFTYSFIVILFGTLGFVVVSHFPEEHKEA